MPEPHFSRTSLPTALVAVVVIAPVAVGAIRSVREHARQPDVSSTIRFEVVSVKRGDPNERGRVYGATMQTGRLRIVNETLGRIVRTAYGVEFPHSIPNERVSGGPEWMETDRFTIEATQAPEPGASLYTALQDQFGLRLVSTRAPVDFLIIDSAPHPSKN